MLDVYRSTASVTGIAASLGPGLLQQAGGFYPSVMGGVIQNAGLLFPVAARQGMSLFSKYKNAKKTRKARKTRKTRKARKQTRRA